MSGAWAPTIQETEKLSLVTAVLPLGVGAGTYQALMALGGDILIQDVSFYLKTPAAGLISLTFQTDDAAPTTLLATVLLAGLLTTKNLSMFNTNLVYLPAGKSIKYTVVGVGSAGQIVMCVRYYKISIGATLG
jgi:hypothetical protein